MSVPTYIQSTSNAPANTTSIVLTLNGVVTGNDILVCVDATSGFDSYAISDGVNSYVSVLGPITSPPNNQYAQWFMARSVTGGSLTITISTSVSTTHFAAAIEVSNVDPATPIQSTDFAGAQSTSNALGNVVSTTKANILAVAMTTAYGLGGVPVSQTLDLAWTQRENIPFASGTPKGSGAVGTQLVAVSGDTVQANSTLSRTASWIALTLLLNPVAAPTLVSIAVTPTSPSIALGQTQQFTAIGTYSDSSTLDITSTATWSSSIPGVATIASGGLATSVSGGMTNITASLSSITSNTAVLTVTLFSISGNAGIAGATVSWTGTSSGSVIADGSGNYSIPGLVDGTYTVTPSLSFYSFSPTNQTVVVSGANITGIDFTAIPDTWSISGNAGIADALVTWTGSSSGSTTADGSGNYSISGLLNGSYTITPTLSGYTFSPNSRIEPVSNANIIGVNFVATVVVPSRGYIPLPFTQRMTAAAAVFPCILIASHQGAQKFAFGNGVTIGALQLSYARLFEVYRELRHQDTANNRSDLVAAVASAVTIVASLKGTIDAMTATGDNAGLLQGMQIVVANALTQVKAVNFDEQ